MTTWQDKVVVITGGAGGIGSAMARWFASVGARVTIVDRPTERLDALAAELGASAGAADITDPDQVRAVFDQCGPVDLLVNSAAIADEDSLLDTTPQRWDAQIDVVLRAPYLCSQAAIPGMRDKGQGVIINISSVNARIYVGNEAYSAAKAGVDSLTRSIAVRYGKDGIRAVGIGLGTVVTPGSWDARLARDPSILERLTQWYPMGRVGRPEDVVSLVAFLGSDQASWLTGTTVMLDGGLTAGNPVMAAQILGEPVP